MSEDAEHLQEESAEESAEELELGHEESTEQSGGETESRARSMGWVPKEDFRGDDSRWVDAETFVERGEKQLPIMRERYKKLEQDLQETRDTLKQFADHHKTVEERAYQRAIEDVKRKKVAAVHDADTEAYLEAEREEDELRKQEPKAIELPEKRPEEDPEFVRWAEDNKWYQEDRVMNAAADALADDYIRQGYRGQALLDKVTEKVKTEFPHKFKNARRERPGSVESPGRRNSRGGKSAADLPAEARKACQKFVKQGLMTEAQYVKEYFGE